jgi:hypothetical protein
MESRAGARFSSSKCPPGPGLENSCELPFGFVWSPLSPTHTPTDAYASCVVSSEQEASEASLPPVLCLTCLSYLNLYADIDPDAGLWTCPLCGSTENVLPPDANRFLASPTVELRQTIVGVDTAVETTSIILVLDANLPRAEAQAVGSILESILPEKLSDTHRIHLGLIIFGKNLSIYQLGVSGIVSADVISSHEGLDMDMDALLEKHYLKEIRSVEDLDCLWRCLAAHYGVPLPTLTLTLTPTNQQRDPNKTSMLPNTTTPPTSRLELLRKRKEARLRKQQQGSSPDAGSSSNSEIPLSPWVRRDDDDQHRHWTQPLRCTGEAVQCAMDLASCLDLDPQPRTARILIFTNGCPNFGDGSVVLQPSVQETKPTSQQYHQHTAPYVVDSVELGRAKEYFAFLGKSAAEGGVGVDVLCTGASELGMPAYLALVEPSAGYALAHDSFTTTHLLHNLQYLLQHTFLSGMYAEETPEKNWIDGCVVDLRMPR